MKISIITVCYNSASTIETTIRSVARQTYQNIEYIVVDGKSTDETLEIIKKYQNTIDKWISEPDKGLYDAMNKGIRASTGSVIAILNSDDLFNNDNAVEKVVKQFNEKPNLDSVYADLFYVAQDDTSKIVRRWKSGKQRSFSKGWHPAHPTFYVKREIYEKYGGFNLDFELAADFELMLRFIEKFEISTYYLKDTLVKMRLGGATNKNLENIKKGNLECLEAFRSNDIKVNRFLYPIYRLAPKLLQYLN